MENLQLFGWTTLEKLQKGIDFNIDNFINEVEVTTTDEVIDDQVDYNTTTDEVVQTPIEKHKQQDYVNTPTKTLVLEPLVVAIKDSVKPESPLSEVCDDAITILNPIDSVHPKENFPNKDIQDKPKLQRDVKSKKAFCHIKTSTKKINQQISCSLEALPKKPLRTFPRFPHRATVSVADLLSIFFQEENKIYSRKKASLIQRESLLKGLLCRTTLNLRDPSIEKKQREGPSSVLEKSYSRESNVTVDMHVPHSLGLRIPNIEGIENIPVVYKDPATNKPLRIESTVHVPKKSSRNLEKIVLNKRSSRRAKRHQRRKLVRHMVKYWNYEEMGPSIMEGVRPKPISRK